MPKNVENNNNNIFAKESQGYTPIPQQSFASNRYAVNNPNRPDENSNIVQTKVVGQQGVVNNVSTNISNQLDTVVNTNFAPIQLIPESITNFNRDTASNELDSLLNSIGIETYPVNA